MTNMADSLQTASSIRYKEPEVLNEYEKEIKQEKSSGFKISINIGDSTI